MFCRPPCSRYENKDNSDDGDERVVAVWAFTMGLLGGLRLEDFGETIARLHDHKGTLVVATRRELPEDCRWAFRRAWEVIGSEPGENVEFIDVNSSEWRGCWGARRFESNWTP